MSQATDNILYIPIQINGGTSVPNDLLERELFIKNGELYVGTGNGGKEMIIGRVVTGATLTGVNLANSLFIKNKDGLVLTETEFNSKKKSLAQSGRVIFIDEGQY